MDDSNENNDTNIDIEELVKVQSRIRGFLGRAKCRKKKTNE